MRRLLVIAMLFGWTGATAEAAVLPVNATLSFSIATFGNVALTGSGIGDSAGGIGGTAAIPAGLISATSAASVPITPPVAGLSLVTVPAPFSHGAATFSPNGALTHNGIANLFLSGGYGGTVALHPIGGGGTAMAVMTGLPITVIGATFSNLGLNATTPTKTLQIMSVSAGIPVTMTVTAFDNRTAGGQGTVQLVAPGSVLLFGGNLGSLPVIGTLTLQFVPEPGTLLLVGAGIAGLTGFGRSRRN